MKKVTMYDMAAELGISVGTMDRALHDRQGISAETKEKVMDLVKKYGYKPNKAARYLSLNARKYKIGVIIQNTPAFFWDSIKRGIRSAEHELMDSGLEIIYHDVGLRQADEIIHSMKALIEQKVDAIALVPLNNKVVKNLIAEARGAGIAVATLNDDIEDSERLFYIGPHMRQSGRMVGELMGRFLQGEGNVVTISGSIESFVYQERLEGFREILFEKFPNIRLAANYTYNFRLLGENADNIIRGLFENLNGIRGIYNIDGSTLVNTGRLIRDMGIHRDIVLIGHEISDKVEELIREDVVSACICQDPFMQGYHVVRYLFSYLTEGRMPAYDRLYTRIDPILKENIVDKHCLINPYY